MIISESELRRIIRQEILNESLFIDNSEEELLEEGIKDKLQSVLFALGLSASMASSMVKQAQGQEPAQIVSSVVDNIFKNIPDECPALDNMSWWRTGENIQGIEDYLADVYEGNDSTENYVKFFIVSAMKDQRLHSGIMRIYENPELIPQDMLNKDTDYNPEFEKNYRFTSPEQKAWLYIKRVLIQAGKKSIQANDTSIFDRAIQDLRERADDSAINNNKFTSTGRQDYKI